MYKVNILFAYLIILALALCQAVLVPALGMGGAHPNILAVAVVFFALYGGRGVGLRTGLFAGLLSDLFGVRFFGLSAAILGSGGYMIGANSNRFYKESPLTHIILTSALSLWYLFARLLAYAVMLRPAVSAYWGGWTATAMVLPPLIYTGAISPFMFFGLSQLFGLREDAI